MSSGGAASLMHKTREEGAELLDKYFTMFGGLGSAIANAKKFLKEHGYVEGLLGRRRRLPDLFLPKYEIYLKDNDDAKNFNPFIGCENRVEESYSVKYWKEVLAEEINRSDEWQRSKDPAWKSNGEISNACYTKMAIRALHGEKYMRQEYRNGKKVWYTKEPTQKLEPVIIQANTGRIAQAERQCFNALIQGCLDANTLIYTENGISKISDYKDKFVKVWDGNEWTISNIVYSGKKQKCILTTGIGSKIICSPDHKFLVINTSGKETFKRLADLKKQDRLVCNDNVPSITERISFRDSLGIDYTGPSNKHNYSFDDIKDDYIRGQVIGRIASDGSYNKKPDGSGYVYILVAEHEKELLEFFANSLPFKYTIREEQKKNQKVYQLIISSTTLYNECVKLDIKHQIHMLFYKNTELLRGFISGYFDGDGTASGYNIALDFGKQADFSAIIKQIQDCLLIFGIKSTAKEFKDRYRVAIRRVDCQKFANNIGFITKVKQDKALVKATIKDYHCFNNKSVTTIKDIKYTDEFIDMFDVCDTERGYFVANGLITHNSAGTLTKQAMIDIYNDPQLRAWDAHLIISVHDEVLVECPEEYAEQVEKRLPEVMINAALKLGITAPAMRCDPYNVSRWYSDAAAVSIRAEFEKLEKGDEKKGIAPLPREEALEKIYENHIEFPKEAIYKAITEGIDLEY